MWKTIKIDGITANGRNGMFKVDIVDILQSDHSDKIFVEVYSKKRGKAAPVGFEGSRKDMILLFESIVDALKTDQG